MAGRRTAVTGGAAIALLLVLASPALAAPKLPSGYHEDDGGLDSAIGINCTSIVTGNPFEETQVTASAAAQGSRRRPIRPGRVFYVRALVGIVGTTCNGAQVEVEVLPPRGVRVAYDKRHPYWIDYPEDAQGPTYSNGRDGVRAGPGRYGGVVLRFVGDDGQVEPWPLANTSGPIAIHVPMVAQRALQGTAARRPRCRAKGSGDPPCTRRRARDHAQVVVEVGAAVAPTLLVAEAGLFARAPLRR